jgi:nickel/cobalt exporter
MTTFGVLTGPGAFAAIAVTAATLGSLHALAPDHWVPFAALGRAQRWPAARTARVTILCGFGHVTVSVILGVVAVLSGLEVVAALGRRLESLAGLLLIAFGLVYGLWGLRRAAGARLHGHVHRHYDHVHEASRVTPWTLFLLFSADPCVAVIPLIVAAAPLGAGAVAAIALIFEAATIGMMVSLVLAAWRGATALQARWFDRYGDAAAGGLIAALGAVLAAVVA